MQAAFLCAGQREQLKKLDDPSEQQCGEHCADTDAVKRAVMEQAQSSADGNHREVKPVLDGGKPQMKHPPYQYAKFIRKSLLFNYTVLPLQFTFSTYAGNPAAA